MATWTLDRPASTAFQADTTEVDSHALPNTPSDLDDGSVTAVSIAVGTNAVTTIAYDDDQLGLDVRIMDGLTILAAIDSNGNYEEVYPFESNAAWGSARNFTAIDFTYINTSATKANWDAATLEYRQLWAKNKGSDGTHIEIAVGTDDLTVTYTPSAASDDLLADNLQSTSQLSKPAIEQVHKPTADDLQSASQLSTPAIAQDQTLLADNLQSASQLSTPAANETTALTADDAQSSSQLSTPAIAQDQTLLADDIQSASQLSTPTLQQENALLADDLQSASELSTPTVAESLSEDVLTADDLQSTSSVTTPEINAHVARLDTAVGTTTNSTSYPISAGNNRCLLVITEGEENNGTAPVPTATFGGISMVHVVGAAYLNTDDTRGDIFFLNDAGIESATGSVITVSNLPSDGSTFHYHSYENVFQTTPTVTDVHTALGGHATLTIDSVDGGAVVCLAANGTAPNSATWSGGVTEQTDLVVGAISHGSTADELTTTGAAESYTGTFATAGNRVVGLAVTLPPAWAVVAGVDVLFADDVESASQISTPDIGQEHDLLADDLQSASEVSTPICFSDPLRLFPITDTTVDGWTDELFGTTDIYTSIYEYTANDSDYIRSSSPPTADIYKCSLVAAFPTPDSTKDQKVQYRYGKSIVDSNNAVDLTVKLIEGASTVIASWSHTNVGTTLTTVEQVLTTLQKESITDYDNLFLQFEAFTQ